MSGLILGGMMQGLGNAGSSIAGSMVQADARHSDLELRMQAQREMQAEKLATMREIAAERAAARGAGGSKDGPFMENVAQGSMAEESMAGRMNMTVPELRKFRESQQSGDMSGYDVNADVTASADTDPENSDAISRRGGTQTVTVKKSPQGLDAFMKDKRAALADIQQEFIYGKAYDDVTKGRSEEQGNKVGAGIINGAISPEAGAQKIGALKGEGAYKEGGNTVFNQYSGDNDPTAVGESEITKNNAKAKHEGDAAKSDTLKSLTQERVSATSAASDARRELATLQGMTDKISSKDKPAHLAAIEKAQAKLDRYETERDQLAARIREYTSTGKVSADKPESDKKADSGDNGIVKSPAAAASTPPDIKSVTGVPAGSSIGKLDPQRGWAVLDKSGKVIGYARK